MATTDADTDKANARGARLKPLGWLAVPLRRLFGHYLFSSLTRRILFLNLAALAVLVVGVLYLNEFRTALVNARVDSLRVQGEIIAGAIANSVDVETDSIIVDPNKLLELQAGESSRPDSEQLDSLKFPINPVEAAALLRRVLPEDSTRARIYDPDANLLFDSKYLDEIASYPLPEIEEAEPSLPQRVWERVLWVWQMMQNLFYEPNLPIYPEAPDGNGSVMPGVMPALTGTTTPARGIDKNGKQVVSVAVPIQRSRAVLGALLLSTRGDINDIVAAERQAILRVFFVAALVTAILSLLLASTIANPLRRLSAAAVRVRRGVRNREEIPDFSERQDEIGNLSAALRDMTKALYARIDAIERFAADVSHELKNPLTSLGSAVETLPLAKDENARERLLDVIQHDVRRLDRLISDISDASRLDAELSREDCRRIDLKAFVGDLVAATRETASAKKPAEVTFETHEEAAGDAFIAVGHDLRLGQVITNLIENARSFVPTEDGRISVTLSRAGLHNLITVEDNGPGIRAEKIDRIFERFYTDRPSGEAFGQNSGLGLSISRQIVEAHGGTLTAENIAGAKPGDIRGARFVISLPAEA